MNNNEKKHKPFNIERALDGCKVVTRDGQEVTQLHRFETSHNDKLDLFGVIDDSVYSFYFNGRSRLNFHTELDLFMAPIKKQGWVNVYLNTLTREFSSSVCSYKTKQLAIDNCDENECFKLIDTVMIEWEE